VSKNAYLDTISQNTAMGTEVRIVDRAGVGAVKCELEGGKARVELGKNIDARHVETGYGRLFFRYGKGLSASLKHLIVDGETPADVGHPNTTLTLRESVALVRYFNGILCAPAAKIDIPRGRDVWLMLLAPINKSPRIDVSKSLLVAEEASVSTSLSAGEEGLRYNLNAYGSGFRRAGLELVKRINTGTSLTHGLERITVKQRLAEVKPGESIQSIWTPSKGPTELVLAIMRSFPSLKDITAILQALGCSVRNNLFLGPNVTPNPFTIGDGGPTEYRVRLTLNGRTVDEAEVKVFLVE
jgi:hypothetical protein